MSNIIGRNYKTPPGYNGSLDSTKLAFDRLYCGFIMDNRDDKKMGRLKVWIPELSGDPADESKWFTARYMSFFAGSTPLNLNGKSFKDKIDPDHTQSSYGWWGIVPDTQNEVVVGFLNDTGHAVILGYLVQEYMNHMMPAIGSDPSYQTDNTQGVNPPVMEYNKWGPDAAKSPDGKRPRFEPLHKGLVSQGLYQDSQRGPSNASARNVQPDGSPARVYGFLSPKGNHWYINEEEDSEYIRIRTKGGAQVLVNETQGYIYINSKSGNSWVEISDLGIDIYSSKNVSMRARGDLNLHADKDINIDGNTINLRSRNTCRIQSVGGDMNINSSKSVNIQGSSNCNLYFGGQILASSGGSMSLTSGGSIFMSAPSIKQNSGNSATAGQAETPQSKDHQDVSLTPPNYSKTTLNSIVSRLPTHEPCPIHNSSQSAGGEQARKYDGPPGTGGKYGGANDPNMGTAYKNKAGDSAGKNISGTATEYTGEQIGSLSGKYESNGKIDAIGHDRTGGWSYGSHQIAADTGSMSNYMDYLKENNPDQYEKLMAAGGVDAAKRGDPAFKDAWKNLAAEDPQGFKESQEKFFQQSYYQPAADKVLNKTGLDVGTRSRAVNEVLYSTSIQHGTGGATNIFNRALAGKDINSMSDEEIINAIYDERSRPGYFASSSPAVQASVAKRFVNERQDALAMLRKEQANK